MKNSPVHPIDAEQEVLLFNKDNQTDQRVNSKLAKP